MPLGVTTRAAVWLGLATGPASAVDLFDATLGTPPSDQGWLFLASPLFSHSVTQTPGPAFTTLDTLNPRSDQGGYFGSLHPDLPAPLDRHAGFVVRVTLRVDIEAHNPRDDNADGVHDRAGFSLIVVCDDLRAIEMAFWEDEVWAYADDSLDSLDLFTHAEGAPIDTTAGLREYALHVHSDGYSLRVDGQQLLCGPLRDYTAFAGSPDVYETPNFLLFGDDTGAAECRVEVASLSIEDAPHPCPADLASPCLVLDFSDVLAFLSAFGAQEPPADLAPPHGVFDFSDVLAFLSAFAMGCP